jgi:hypothetical protein
MRLRYVGAGLVLVMAVPAVALAGPGKAGMWEVSVTMGGMPQIPAEDMAKMKAMGMHMPMGNTFTTQKCVTPEEAAATKPPPMGRNNDCQMGKVSTSGGSLTGDMTCSGPNMTGTGHFQVSYSSPEHYTGQMAFNGSSHGHPVNMTNKFEGKWLSASCGTTAH